MAIDKLGRPARIALALIVVALGLAAVPATVLTLAPSADAYQRPTSGTGSTLTYPSGVTVTSGVSGPGNKLAGASSTAFGAPSYGYVASDYTPAPPASSAGFTTVVPTQPVTASCPAYGLCPDLGTFTFTFSRPVRNPRMHINEIGGVWVQGTSTNTTSTRLTLTTPGVTMAVADGRNLRISGGDTIETVNKTYFLNCETNSTPSPGCGTVAFTGVVSSLTFDVSSFTALRSGPSVDAHAPDAFPVTFTFDEDFGDAPASYDQGDAARAAVSDLTMGPALSNDNVTVGNATVSPHAGATALADTFDDAVPLSSLSANATTYSATVAVNGASSAGRACGWVDFDQDGIFDNPSERACSDFAAGATSATLTWTGLSGIARGNTYARFRVGYNAAQTESPIGASDSGEVEDYPLTVAGPPISCLTPNIYGVDQNPNGAGDRVLWNIDYQTGQMVSVATIPAANNPAYPSLNGLAVDSANNYAYMVTQANNQTTATVVRVNTVTGAISNYPRPASHADFPTPSGGMVMGAFDATTGIYYMGLVSSGVLSVYGFDTATNAWMPGRIARISLASGTNGDFAFDGQGRLYVISAGILLVLNDPLPSAGTTTPPLAATTTIATPSGGVTGAMAFGSDGYIYVSVIVDGVRTLQQLHPASGDVVDALALTPTTNTIGDFASCALPATITVRKNLPGGRILSSDQFRVEVTGGGLSSGNSGTTAGNETGVQDQTAGEVAGPVLGLVGPTYTITETGVAGTDLSDYTSSWECRDRLQGNAVVASGSGSSGSFVLSPVGADGSDVVCTFTNEPILPGISLSKDADRTELVVGDTITYTFTGTNTGNGPLDDVTVSETAFSGSGSMSPITCIPAQGSTLAVAATISCTATYVVSQADVDAGQLTNTAEIVGTASNGDEVTDSDDASVPPIQEPAISLVKDVAETEVVAGGTLHYTFTATNTGNVSLSNVSISEDAFTGSGAMSALSCTPSQPVTLAPDAVLSCTATYVASQADVDAGGLDNVASVTGTPPTGGPVTDTDNVSVPATPAPGLDLVKRVDSVDDVNGNGLTDAGDEIYYVFDVENTGNVTMDPVVVDDPVLDGLGITITCDPSALAPGESVTCEADAPYVITAADVDAGGVTNVATATGTPPTGPPTTTPPSTTTTPTDQTPDISLVKDVAETELVAGGTLHYTFTATNTGNVSLSNVSISEDAFTGSGAMSALSCTPSQPATLAPAAQIVCTATYAVTQADVDAGVVDNTASATGTPPTGPPVTDTDDATVPSTPAPGLTLVKRVDSVDDVNGNGLTDA
ncbi:MAG: GEVED domain-containing protein, partial [Propionibacteriales bacterium]|nr:GEVED domain-containing protein [Propionibacteriales bacterium]